MKKNWKFTAVVMVEIEVLDEEDNPIVDYDEYYFETNSYRLAKKFVTTGLNSKRPVFYWGVNPNNFGYVPAHTINPDGCKWVIYHNTNNEGNTTESGCN